MPDYTLENVVIPEDQKENGEVHITNTKKHISDANEVIIQGTLIRKVDLEFLSYFTVCTRTGRNKDEVSFLSVQVPKKVLETMPTVEERDHVLLHGVLRSYWNAKENVHTTVIEAIDYEKTTSALAERFGVESGRIYDDSYNKLFIGGEITRLTTTKRGSFQLTIKTTDTEGAVKYVNCSLIVNNPKAVVPQLIIGNRICGVGEIRTFVKEPETPDGKKQHFQRYFLLDILEI